MKINLYQVLGLIPFTLYFFVTGFLALVSGMWPGIHLWMAYGLLFVAGFGSGSLSRLWRLLGFGASSILFGVMIFEYVRFYDLFIIVMPTTYLVVACGLFFYYGFLQVLAKKKKNVH